MLCHAQATSAMHESGTYIDSPSDGRRELGGSNAAERLMTGKLRLDGLGKLGEVIWQIPPQPRGFGRNGTRITSS